MATQQDIDAWARRKLADLLRKLARLIRLGQLL